MQLVLLSYTHQHTACEACTTVERHGSGSTCTGQHAPPGWPLVTRAGSAALKGPKQYCAPRPLCRNNRIIPRLSPLLLFDGYSPASSTLVFDILPIPVKEKDGGLVLCDTPALHMTHAWQHYYGSISLSSDWLLLHLKHLSVDTCVCQLP